MNYIAIIGDIINSKNIKNRKEVQQKLQASLDRINEDYKDALSAKLMITLGDEFQGLVNVPYKVIDIIEKLSLDLYPIEIRFGIGEGKITTDIDYDRSNEIDGPAYHYAREMIEQFDKKENSNDSPFTLAKYKSYNKEIDQAVNTILSLNTLLRSKWTPRQNEIVKTYLNNYKIQTHTALELKVEQSTISKSLKAANFSTYYAANETLKDILREKARS